MKINGSLVFDASSASEIQNLRVEKVASNPTWVAADSGRVIFNTTAGILYIGVGAPTSNWVALATGGDATALQTEVNNLEAALGTGINPADGTFVAAAFSAFNNVTAPTTYTDVLYQLDQAIEGKDALAELNDVDVTGVVGGQFLQYNGSTSKWEDRTLVLDDASDVTLTAPTAGHVLYVNGSGQWVNAAPGATSGVQGYDAELAALATVVSGADVLPYFTGSGSATGTTLTSFARTLLDDPDLATAQATLGIQPVDSTLTAIASLTGGIVVVSADGTAAYARTLIAPSEGITITNPDGVAGNPTFALANDLNAYEGLATTGYVVRTGDGTATTRAITGTAGNVVVTNGDGVASNTNVDLAAVVQATGGSFLKVTLDGYGRVTANTAVTTADITALVDATYVNVAGDTMTGTLNMGGNTITGLATPTADTEAATKAYVDALANGLSWKDAVRVASTGPATLATAFAAGQTVDGVTLVAGDRILIKDQATASENGIYIVQASGAPVRAADMNDAAEFDGAALFVQEGTVNQSSGWTQTATVATVGTDSVTFSQFTGGALYTWGTGLGNSGNTIFVNLGAGISELPSDEIGIDLYAPTGGGLILTQDGSAYSTNAAAKLHLKLAAAGGLTQDATGLYIPADGVTNAMLLNDFINTDGDSGTGSIALGGTLEIQGNSVQGIVTSVSGGVFVVTASDASTSQKGTASFDSGDFAVASGAVSIKAGGVDNNQLAFSTVTFAGNTGTDAVALGETMTISGSGAITTAVGTANDMTVSVATATTSTLGVASFSSDFFSVSGGAVSLAATLDDLTNVSLADAATTDDILTKTASDWQPVSRAALVGSTSIDAHNDVTITSATGGQALIYNGSQWVNRKIYHTETFASASTWVVTHSLGQKFCNVTVADSADEVVIPQSITFNSTTQLTVTFNTAIAGQVMVTGVAAGA